MFGWNTHLPSHSSARSSLAPDPNNGLFLLPLNSLGTSSLPSAMTFSGFILSPLQYLKFFFLSFFLLFIYYFTVFDNVDLTFSLLEISPFFPSYLFTFISVPSFTAFHLKDWCSSVFYPTLFSSNFALKLWTISSISSIASAHIYTFRPPIHLVLSAFNCISSVDLTSWLEWAQIPQTYSCLNWTCLHLGPATSPALFFSNIASGSSAMILLSLVHLRNLGLILEFFFIILSTQPGQHSSSYLFIPCTPTTSVFIQILVIFPLTFHPGTLTDVPTTSLFLLQFLLHTASRVICPIKNIILFLIIKVKLRKKVENTGNIKNKIKITCSPAVICNRIL